MRIPPIVSLASAALLLFSSPLLAQTPTGSQKTPHTGDLTGVWYPSSVNTFNFIWTDAQGQHLNTLPLTPWGQEKFKGNHPIGGEYTALTSNDPNSECLPPGVPNIYTHAYPVEILQVQGRAIMFFEYGHFVRQIFTDGREHVKDANPTWMGDSTGKWEGDTLVVDSTGFNDKTWLDVAGHPHSESLHLVERMRRADYDTLMIDITLEDPQAYTAILKTQRKYILKPSWNIMEYICEDTRVKFDDFEKKVGAKGTKTAEATVESGSSQSIVGDWTFVARGIFLFRVFQWLAHGGRPICIHEPSVSKRSGSGRWNRHRPYFRSSEFSWEAFARWQANDRRHYPTQRNRP
jgi:hypothetical protein